MYYKRRKMAGNQQQNQQENHGGQSTTIKSADLSHQLCFVHQVADLPLVSASVEQIFSYYEKAKKMNKLVDSSLNLAEHGVKFVAGKIEPIRRLLDAPIVAVNKVACNQLEKLETIYPVIHITPDELFENGKVYYDNSYIKSGVEKAQAVISYGQEKVNSSVELANSGSKIITQNVNRGIETVKLIVGHTTTSLLSVAEGTISKLTPYKVEPFFRDLRIKTKKYSNHPDLGLLVLVQNMATAFTFLTDYLDKYLSFAPEIIHSRVTQAVEYCHELRDTFNKAATLGELRDEVIKEAKVKLALIQSTLSSIIDHLVVHPPICWLASLTKTTNGIINKNSENGVTIFNDSKENKKNQ